MTFLAWAKIQDFRVVPNLKKDMKIRKIDDNQ